MLSDFTWNMTGYIPKHQVNPHGDGIIPYVACLLYTSDAADDLLCVDLGGRRIIHKKKKETKKKKKKEERGY